MAQNDMLKRYLDAGVAFTDMTRARAKGIIDDLVKSGEIQRDQAQSRVEELVERSRRNTETLVDLVRKQVSTMGLATKADITRLEKRIAALAGTKATPQPTPWKAAPAKKAPARTAPAKKAAAPAGKKAAPAKKSAAAKKA